jgi:hypothetical protein
MVPARTEIEVILAGDVSHVGAIADGLIGITVESIIWPSTYPADLFPCPIFIHILGGPLDPSN